MAVQKVKLSVRQILDETTDVSDAVFSTLCEWSSKTISRNLASIDRAKYSIFKNDAEQAKFLKNLASRFRIYLKKEDITEEEKNRVIEDMITLYTRVADKFGSLPAVDVSGRFMTDYGDIQRDIFPTYSVSYKTMHQMEAVAETLAIKMGIIPDLRYKETPKEVEEYSMELAKKNELDSFQFREHDFQVDRAFRMLPYNMRALNDSNTFAKYMFSFLTEVHRLDDEDYKAFFELAKKLYKIGRA